ncbi:MAG: GntR family transcriptional regulator, partial [Prevotella sp.]|nr:GntR family transcriptional regulator [Prevotella sp.]MCI6861737.1 GntR family transcriptional regulator [Prevotella sp.]
CRLGDKSDAADIQEQFGVSKRTYKQAVGDLYKRRLIRITDNGIELI